MKIFKEALFKDHFGVPPEDPGNSYHLYVIRLQNESIRNYAHDFLKERKILTQIHYLPVYKHPYYVEQFGAMELPGAEKYYSGCLSIPLYPKMSEADQDRVIEALRDFCTRG